MKPQLLKPTLLLAFMLCSLFSFSQVNRQYYSGAGARVLDTNGLGWSWPSTGGPVGDIVFISFGGATNSAWINEVSGGSNGTLGLKISDLVDTNQVATSADLYLRRSTSDGGTFNSPNGTYPTVASWQKCWQVGAGSLFSDTIEFVIDSLEAGQHLMAIAFGGSGTLADSAWFEVIGNAGPKGYYTSYDPSGNTTVWDSVLFNPLNDSVKVRVAAPGNANLVWLFYQTTGNWFDSIGYLHYIHRKKPWFLRNEFEFAP